MNQSTKEDTEEITGIRKALRRFFREWNEKSAFEPGDDAGTKIKKLTIRIGGVIMLIVFSPALILALVIAFLVAL